MTRTLAWIVGRLNGLHARVELVAVAATRSRVVGWCGLLLVLASSLSPWLATPLRGRVFGFSIPLWMGQPLALAGQHPLAPLSFGEVAFAIAVAATVTLRRESSKRALFWLGASAALLGGLFFAALVLRCPETLQDGIHEERERQHIARFSATHLDGNAAALKTEAPARPRGLSERVSVAADLTGLTAFGMGPWLAVSGGLLLLGASPFLGSAPRPRAWEGVLLLLIAVACGSALGWRTVPSQWHLARADRLLAEGSFELAVEAYERSRALEQAQERDSGFSHRLGSALYQLGRKDQPEYFVFLADNYETHGDAATAAQLYKTALALRPDLDVARQQATDVLLQGGLLLFEQGNADSAIARWQDAAFLSPERLDVHFLLAHALYVVHREDQREAIQENEYLLSRVRDRLVRADVYVNLGLCYSRQKDFVKARQMFRRSFGSFDLVKRVINFNALEGLQGI